MINVSEHDHQKSLFQWATLQECIYPDLVDMYAIPNGGKRGKAEAGRLKAEGVKAGTPDICLPAAYCGYHGLYIEMKKEDGRPSKIQKERIERYNKRGYLATVCYGWLEARQLIINYLEGKLK